MEQLYFACLIGLAAQVIRRHVWRILPCFFVSVVAAALFQLAYQPYSPEWLRAAYPWLVVPLLGFRVLALAEALMEHAGPVPRRVVLFSSCGVLAAVALWIAFPADPVFNAVLFRRLVLITGAAYLGAYIAVQVLTLEWRPGFFGRHVWFLFASWVLFAAAPVVRLACPDDYWWAANGAFYMLHSLLLIAWSVRLGLVSQPSSLAALDRPGEVPSPHWPA